MQDFLVENKIAARRIGRFTTEVDNGQMTLRVIWMQIHYSDTEELPASFSTHSFYELHYIIQGQASFSYSKNHLLSLSEGQFIVVPPAQKHASISCSEDLVKFVLGFYIESKNVFINNALSTLSGFPRTVYEGSDRMKTMLDMMLDTAYNLQSLSHSIISNLLECFVIEFLRVIDPRHIYKETETLLNNNIRIKKIKSFIILTPNRNLKVKEIAHELNISERHLNRIVKEELGCTIGSLIDKIRCDFIKDLLLTSPMSIAQIAKYTGFNSSSGMIQFFKRIEGCTPAAFRRKEEIEKLCE